MDPESGTMVPVATYYGARRLYEKHSGVQISWPGGSDEPPYDVPYCGFNGEAKACQEPEPFPIALTVLGITMFLFVVAGIAAGLIYRKIRFEQDLADCWWKVRWEDIQFVTRADGKRSQVSLGVSDGSIMMSAKLSSQTNTRASSMVSSSSWCSFDDPSNSVTIYFISQASSRNSTLAAVNGVLVGNYRGIRVAIKELQLKKFHLSRTLLCEFKLVCKVELCSY